MSLNPEAVQKLLVEMDQQLRTAEAELQMTAVQLQRKLGALRVARLTQEEIGKEAAGARLWEGVGKAFVLTDKATYTARLASDETVLAEQVKALDTKKAYLDKTVENTVGGMNKILGKA